NPLICISYLLVLSTLISLGMWQLKRRALKLHHNTKVTAFLARQHEPVDLSKALSAYAELGPYASDVSVQVQGTFLPSPIIFHDNRILNHHVGLHALALFRPSNHQMPTVLVNLGWVSWPGTDRRHLPTVRLPTESQALIGTLFAPNPKLWTLEHEVPAPTHTGWLLQKIDLAQIQTTYGTPLAPFTLRLKPDSWPRDVLIPDAGTPEQPIRHFTTTTQWPVSPEKHLGYALQWFTMALVLSGLFIRFNFQRRHHFVVDDHKP
ncbi:MAG: SURF1 family protein, partial [Gammaproteobacteria bacterium]